MFLIVLHSEGRGCSLCSFVMPCKWVKEISHMWRLSYCVTCPSSHSSSHSLTRPRPPSPDRGTAVKHLLPSHFDVFFIHFQRAKLAPLFFNSPCGKFCLAHIYIAPYSISHSERVSVIRLLPLKWILSPTQGHVPVLIPDAVLDLLNN